MAIATPWSIVAPAGTRAIGGGWPGGRVGGAAQLGGLGASGAIQSNPAVVGGAAQLGGLGVGGVVRGYVAPAWLGNVNQFVAVPNSVHAGQATYAGVSNNRLAYCGLATDGHARIVIASAGGHGDYSGNEVTVFDTAAVTLAWAELKPRWPTPVVDVAYYSTSPVVEPTSRHLYHAAQWCSTRQRLVLHRTRFSYGSAMSFGATNGLNLETGVYDPVGTYADGMTAVCRDAADRCWAGAGGFYLHRWNPVLDTWTSVMRVAGDSYGLPKMMAHDSRRDRLFGLYFNGVSLVARAYSALSTDLVIDNAVTLTGAGVAVLTATAEDEPCMVYDPDGDRFIVWYGAANQLLDIRPNAGLSWTCEPLAHTGTAPTPALGAFSRMAHLPGIKSLIFMSSYELPLVALRLA